MTTQTSENTHFTSFKAFYPFYLNEHKDGTCRTLHFIGSWLVIGVIALTIRPVAQCFCAALRAPVLSVPLAAAAKRWRHEMRV